MISRTLSGRVVEGATSVETSSLTERQTTGVPSWQRPSAHCARSPTYRTPARARAGAALSCPPGPGPAHACIGDVRAGWRTGGGQHGGEDLELQVEAGQAKD